MSELRRVEIFSRSQTVRGETAHVCLLLGSRSLPAEDSDFHGEGPKEVYLVFKRAQKELTEKATETVPLLATERTILCLKTAVAKTHLTGSQLRRLDSS